MAELTFNSAGVSAREIDLTGPVNVPPVGIPAGVIGTANEGPAFVPITVGNLQDFFAVYGPTDAEKFGPLAVSEWLRNRQAVTYLRVLGIGQGLQRASDGIVAAAGFVAGDQLVQDNGLLQKNSFAEDAGPLGRTFFLGCTMVQSGSSTIFADAGMQTNVAQPIVRGVLISASGVLPRLAGPNTPVNEPDSITAPFTTSNLAGYFTGSVELANAADTFVMVLNGHKGTDSSFPNVVTASFDPQSPSYFANIFNQDPDVIEDAGYVLYSHYDVYRSFAVVSGSGVLGLTGSNGTKEDVAFIVPGAAARNVGDLDTPNYEGFEDRFRTAVSPYIISQKFGGDPKSLFRIHALSDGVVSNPDTLGVKVNNDRFKITISNVASSRSETDKYGSFDLSVRAFDDTDDDQVVLERFSGLSLNPSSDRYIAKIIGDQNIYLDLDTSVDEQRLTVDGSYPNRSSFIRVEITDELTAGQIDPTALPVGFRGPDHLVTSGSTMLQAPTLDNLPTDILQRAVQLPVPFRESLLVGSGANARINRRLHWGVQFEKKIDSTDPNASQLPEPTLAQMTRYFPNLPGATALQVQVGANAGTSDVSGSILDSDRFNNNKFSLENIQVVTGSDGKVDLRTIDQWTYVRNGSITPSAANKTRALNVEDDFSVGSLRALNKFTFFVQGGFDGVNIFDQEKREISDLAIKREIDDSNQGEEAGPSVRAYKKALTVMSNDSDVDVQLLTIPGIRQPIITDEAISTAEARFDALYIMDIEQKDTLNSDVTSSVQLVNVQNTVTNFSNRSLNSSFAAAYFPDVLLPDPVKNVTVQVPPSVAVLGAFALNDRLGHPWFAPAGFTRGALQTTEDAAVKLNRENLDRLYEVDINPVTSFPNQDGVVVWGQKTLKAEQSSLDRVNVRRLLVQIRREVKAVGKRLLFEPNREETLSKFSSLVNPILQRIQEQQGLVRFRVIIDTSTTTQADVENNTIRGKIFVQPTRTAEFVALDFEVTNDGQGV